MSDTKKDEGHMISAAEEDLEFEDKAEEIELEHERPLPKPLLPTWRAQKPTRHKANPRRQWR